MKGYGLELEERNTLPGWMEPAIALTGLLALAFFVNLGAQKQTHGADAALLHQAEQVVATPERALPESVGPVSVIDGRVEIEGTILFPKGSATLTDSGAKLLGELVPVLQGFLGNDGGMLMVSGFTDDLGINTSEFPSNWELSALRATHVVRSLVRTGFPERRIFAAAFGENRPQVENRGEDLRRMNRRVELIRVSAQESR